ncbi:hypothetical protein MMC13_007770 [Lambiella insularis]|nr:hypothetical protein [Lambiella insularis]
METETELFEPISEPYSDQLRACIASCLSYYPQTRPNALRLFQQSERHIEDAKPRQSETLLANNTKNDPVTQPSALGGSSAKSKKRKNRKQSTLKTDSMTPEQSKQEALPNLATELKESLELANWAYSRDDVDTSLKLVVEDHVERLRTALIAADKILDKCFDETGNLRRAYFFYRGEKNLRASMKNLEQWQQAFWTTISLIEMKRRILPDPLLLTPSKFKTCIQENGQYCSPLEPGSHIWCAQGQLLDEELRDVSVIIEQKRKITTGVAEVQEIASCLSHQASISAAPRGILKCLGYREKPNLELVFELPTRSIKLQTLQRLITTDVDHGYAGGRPLDFRYRLAQQISEAILSSPDNQNQDHHDLDFGVPYLTDWTMLRKIDTPSSMVGENDWQRDVYRHPKRHGLQPEMRYNMGHDIYSLGVCLLEIGLWEPLIDRRHDLILPCATYREAAVKSSGLLPEDARKIAALTESQPIQQKAATAAIKTLTRPANMQRTLIALAQDHLPSRMGILYTSVVLSCLRCLERESGFGDAEIFEKNKKMAIGVQFGEKVLQPLSSLVS